MVETMPPEEAGLADVLSARRAISRIDAAFDVVFEKADSEMWGDAVLDITKEGDLHLKVYQMGILGMDLTSRNGVTKSSPRLDRNKTFILTLGLRHSLFWWNMKDPVLDEEENFIVMKDDGRKVWLDKKSKLPLRQKILFDDGRELSVSYSNPAKNGDVWYQSRMRIELSRYAVTLIVKEISFAP
jgi:hypothetical protein